MPFLSSGNQFTNTAGVATWNPTQFPVVFAVTLELDQSGMGSYRRFGYLSLGYFLEVTAGNFIEVEQGLGSVWVRGTVFYLPRPVQVNFVRFRQSGAPLSNQRVRFRLQS